MNRGFLRVIVLLLLAGAALAIAWWQLREPEPAPASHVEEKRVVVPIHLASATPPGDPPEASPKVLLVLPFVDETPWCPADAWLRDWDRTLAAFAGVYLDLNVVEPARSQALAESLRWHTARAEERQDLVSVAADRTGAGLVVWGTLEATGPGVELRARSFHSRLAVEPWDGVRLEATAPTPRGEEFFEEGPYQLLSALARRHPEIPEPPWTSRPPSEDVRAAYERAWETFHSGDPALMVRAEASMARIAAENPYWKHPWFGLSVARALRARLFGPAWTHRFVYEGPQPARHIARLFADPTHEEQVWLAYARQQWGGTADSKRRLADHARRSGSDLARILAGRQAPSSDSDSPLERTLSESWSSERRDVLPPSLDRITGTREFVEELHRRPYFLPTLIAIAHRQGNWSQRLSYWFLYASHGAEMALEGLRQECAARGRSCEETLVEFLSFYSLDQAPIPISSLLDDEEYDRYRLRLRKMITDGDLPAGARESLPDDSERLQQDPGFASRWILARSLVEITNDLLQLGEGPTGPAWSLLTVSPRDLARQGIETVLASASQPLMIGAQRGQRNEVMPYIHDLEPFMTHWRAPLYARSLAYSNTQQEQGAWLDDNAWIQRDPWDQDILPRWVRMVDWQWQLNRGGVDMETVLDHLTCLVPRSEVQTSRIAWAHKQTGNLAQSRKVLEEGLKRFASPALLLEQDDLLYASGAPFEERQEILRTFGEAEGFSADIRARLARLYLHQGDQGPAREHYRVLLEERGTFYEEACASLAELEHRKSNLEEGLDALEECARRAPNQWQAATLYNRLGRIHRDHDRFEDSVQWIHRARERVGAQAITLKNLAVSYEVMGEAAEARRLYEEAIEIYPRAGWLKSAYAWFLLRQGDRTKAWDLFRQVAQYDADRLPYFGLWQTARQMGNIEEFRKFAFAKRSWASHLILAESLLEEGGNLGEARRLLRGNMGRYPRSQYGFETMGRLELMEANEAEAEQRFREALVIAPSFLPARLGLVRALLRQGQRDAAVEQIRILERQHPLDQRVALARHALFLYDDRPDRATAVVREALEFDTILAITGWVNERWETRARLLALLERPLMAAGGQKDATWFERERARVLKRLPWRDRLPDPEEIDRLPPRP